MQPDKPNVTHGRSTMATVSNLSRKNVTPNAPQNLTALSRTAANAETLALASQTFEDISNPLSTADLFDPALVEFAAEFHQRLLHDIGERNFNNWFLGKTALARQDDRVVIRVSNPFSVSWMQRQFRSNLMAAAVELLGPSASVEFLVLSKSTGDERLQFLETVASQLLEARPDTITVPQLDNTSTAGATTEQNSADAKPRASKTASESPASKSGRKPKESRPGDVPSPTSNPSVSAPHAASPAASLAAGTRRYADLADLVVGSSNELAVTAALQVSDDPSGKIQPLYLFGGVGCGKTHLLEGIYRRIRRQYPSLQVILLTAEAFANYFTEALRDHKLPGFRHKFRNVDVLLIDDVEFFDGKRMIQEEFLHTLKQMERCGRQAVMTADRHPRLFSRSSEELTTRMLSGLLCRVEAADLTMRREVLTRRAAALALKVSDSALDYIAARFSNNVRELEGALNSLSTWQAMTGGAISETRARQVLGELEQDCLRMIRIADVERTVCRFFGVEAEDLRSSTRVRSLSQPRMLAIYLSRKLTESAYREIGEYFGGRNHSTTLSAARKVESQIKSGATIRIAARGWAMEELVGVLEQQIRAG